MYLGSPRIQHFFEMFDVELDNLTWMEDHYYLKFITLSNIGVELRWEILLFCVISVNYILEEDRKTHSR